jgi:hypothetical protein
MFKLSVREHRNEMEALDGAQTNIEPSYLDMTFLALKAYN